MEPKKLKLLTNSLFLLLFCAVMLGTGCEPGNKVIDDSSPDSNTYDPNSIIGKWEWLYSLGGFSGGSHPEENESVTLEFTEDSIGIRRVNNNVTFQKEFHISKDTLFWKDEPTGRRFLITQDTLELQYLGSTYPILTSTYKRIN